MISWDGTQLHLTMLLKGRAFRAFAEIRQADNFSLLMKMGIKICIYSTKRYKLTVINHDAGLYDHHKKNRKNWSEEDEYNDLNLIFCQPNSLSASPQCHRTLRSDHQHFSQKEHDTSLERKNMHRYHQFQGQWLEIALHFFSTQVEIYNIATTDHFFPFQSHDIQQSLLVYTRLYILIQHISVTKQEIEWRFSITYTTTTTLRNRTKIVLF